MDADDLDAETIAQQEDGTEGYSVADRVYSREQQTMRELGRKQQKQQQFKMPRPMVIDSHLPAHIRSVTRGFNKQIGTPTPRPDKVYEIAKSIVLRRHYDDIEYTPKEIEEGKKSAADALREQQDNLYKWLSDVSFDQLGDLALNPQVQDAVMVLHGTQFGSEEEALKQTGSSSKREFTKKILEEIARRAMPPEDVLKMMDKEDNLEKKLKLANEYFQGIGAAKQGEDIVHSLDQAKRLLNLTQDGRDRIIRSLGRYVQDPAQIIQSVNLNAITNKEDQQKYLNRVVANRREELKVAGETDADADEQARVYAQQVNNLAYVMKAETDGSAPGLFISFLMDAFSTIIESYGRYQSEQTDENKRLLEFTKDVHRAQKGGVELTDSDWQNIIDRFNEGAPESEKLHSIAEAKEFYNKGYNLETERFVRQAVTQLNTTKLAEGEWFKEFAAGSGYVLGYMLPAVIGTGGANIVASAAFGPVAGPIVGFALNIAAWYPIMFLEAYDEYDANWDTTTPEEAKIKASMLSGWVNATTQALELGIFVRGAGYIYRAATRAGKLAAKTARIAKASKTATLAEKSAAKASRSALDKAAEFVGDSITNEPIEFAGKYFKELSQAGALAIARASLRWGVDMTIEGIQEASEDVVKHAAREVCNAHIHDIHGNRAKTIEDVANGLWDTFKTAFWQGLPAMLILRGGRAGFGRVAFGAPMSETFSLVQLAGKGEGKVQLAAAINRAQRLKDDGVNFDNPYVRQFIGEYATGNDEVAQRMENRQYFRALSPEQQHNLRAMRELIADAQAREAKFGGPHDKGGVAKAIKFYLKEGTVVGPEVFYAQHSKAAEKHFMAQSKRAMIFTQYILGKRRINAINRALEQRYTDAELEARRSVYFSLIKNGAPSQEVDAAMAYIRAFRREKAELESSRQILTGGLSTLEKAAARQQQIAESAYKELEGRSATTYARTTQNNNVGAYNSTLAFLRLAQGDEAESHVQNLKSLGLNDVIDYFKDVFEISAEDLNTEESNAKQETNNAEQKEKEPTQENEEPTQEKETATQEEEKPKEEVKSEEKRTEAPGEEKPLTKEEKRMAENRSQNEKAMENAAINKMAAETRRKLDRHAYLFTPEEIKKHLKDAAPNAGVDFYSIDEGRLDNLIKHAQLSVVLRENKDDKTTIADKYHWLDVLQVKLPNGAPVGGRGFAGALQENAFAIAALRDAMDGSKEWRKGFYNCLKDALKVYVSKNFLLTHEDVNSAEYPLMTRCILESLVFGNGAMFSRLISSYSVMRCLWMRMEQAGSTEDNIATWFGFDTDTGGRAFYLNNELVYYSRVYANRGQTSTELANLSNIIKNGTEAQIEALRDFFMMKNAAEKRAAEPVQEEAAPEETQEEQPVEEAAIEEVETQEEQPVEEAEEAQEEEAKEEQPAEEMKEPQQEEPKEQKKEFRRKSGNRGLHYAIQDGDIEWARRLLNKSINSGGANANSYDKYGYAQLHYAATKNVELVKLLLGWGATATINKQAEFGITPLYRAAYRGHLDIVKVLLAAGADPKIVCGNNGTAADAAERAGHTQVAEYIRNYNSTGNPPEAFLPFMRTGKIPEVGPAYNPRMVTPADNRTLRDTVRHWIKGVYVYVLNNAEFNAAAARAKGAYILRDHSDIMGFYDPNTKEVVVRENAAINTILHELGWHATFDWARENNPAMFEKLKEYARNAPEKVKQFVREVYPDIKEGSDGWLNEVGAVFFSEQYAERMEQVLSDKESKSWLQKLRAFFTRAWRAMMRAFGGERVDVERLTKMHYNDMVAALAEEFAQGKTLGPIAERRAVNKSLETMFQQVNVAGATEEFREEVNEAGDNGDALWKSWLSYMGAMIIGTEAEGKYSDKVRDEEFLRNVALRAIARDVADATAEVNRHARHFGRFGKKNMQAAKIPEFASDAGGIEGYAKKVRRRVNELVMSGYLRRLNYGKIFGARAVAEYMKQILVPQYEAAARYLYSRNTNRYRNIYKKLEKMVKQSDSSEMLPIAEEIEKTIKERMEARDVLLARREAVKKLLKKYKGFHEREMEEERARRSLAEYAASVAEWATRQTRTEKSDPIGEAMREAAKEYSNVEASDVARTQAGIKLAVLNNFALSTFNSWNTEQLTRFQAYLESILSVGKKAQEENQAEQEKMLDAFYNRVAPAILNAAKNHERGVTNLWDNAANMALQFTERLDELTRYSDLNLQAEARAEFAELGLQLNVAHNNASTMFNRENEKLSILIADALDVKIGEGGIRSLATDPVKFSIVLAKAFKPVDGSERFSREKRKRNILQLVHQYATFNNPDYEKRFAGKTEKEILELEKRKGKLESPLDTWRAWQMNEALGEFIGPKWRHVADEVSKMYLSYGPLIDEQSRKDTGMSLSFNEEGYYPIVVDNVEYQQNVVVLGQMLTIPNWLSRRRFNYRYFDENADLVAVFRRHVYDVSHYVHYGDVKPFLRDFVRGERFEEVRKAIEKTQGKSAAHDLYEHALHLYNGQLDGANLWQDPRNEAVQGIMTFARVMSLFGSINSGAVQVIGSWLAPATTQGWVETGKMYWRGLLCNPVGWWKEVWRLFHSDGFKNRRGNVNMLMASTMSRKTSGRTGVVHNAKLAAAALMAERAGFSFVSFGDAVPVLFNGALFSLMRQHELRQEHPDWTEEQIVTRADQEMWRMTDQTQQSRDIQTRDKYMRDCNDLWKLCIQFRTSPLQYASKEVRAWRDLLAHPNPKTLRKYLSIAVHNHLVAPAAAAIGRSLIRLITASRDDDVDLEEFSDYMDLINLHWSEILIGSLDAIPWIGWLGAYISQQTVDAITGEKEPRFFQNRIIDLPAVASMTNLSTSIGAFTSSLTDEQYGTTVKAADRLGRNFAAYRWISEMWQYFFSEE